MMAVSLKRRVKNFFKARQTSDVTVDIVKYFLMPFASKLQGRGHTAEQAVDAFFATEDRHFYTLIAKENFKLPGNLMLAGNKPVEGAGMRYVAAGDSMLAVIDRVRKSVQVSFKDQEFRLERYEFEAVKDKLDARRHSE